jgi:hypothetical protein
MSLVENGTSTCSFFQTAFLLSPTAVSAVYAPQDLAQNALTKMAPLSSYTLGLVQADKSVVLLNGSQ